MVKMRIIKRDELVELAQRLGVRADWHEPDEQELTIETHGVSFDNAGFWPEETVQPESRDLITEHYITIFKDGDPVADVNIATLLAWATGYEH